MTPFVHRIPLPNPFFEGEINTWLIEDEPLTLVDAGLNSHSSLQALEQGLAQLGYQLEHLQQLILTHRHPDHVGLAKTIADRSGASVFIHELDAEVFLNPQYQATQFPLLLEQKLTAWGASPEILEPLIHFFQQSSITIPEAHVQHLSDGQILTTRNGVIEVHHTPGHSVGHITLKYGPFLLVGDHVLQRITPNIGSGDFQRRGQLANYLAGLDRVDRLATDSTIICPGHGAQFQNLHRRTLEIRQHHAQREQKVLNILNQLESCTIYEMASQLFGSMKDVHLMLGMGEAFSHLDKLAQEQKIIHHHNRFSRLR